MSPIWMYQTLISYFQRYHQIYPTTSHVPRCVSQVLPKDIQTTAFVELHSLCHKSHTIPPYYSMISGIRPIGNFLPCYLITFSIAFFSNSTVISLGTSLPAVIYCSIVAACGPPFFLSALRRSPVERWVHPSWYVANSHIVPLPAPGPPSMNTTFGLGVGLRGSQWCNTTLGAGATPFFYTAYSLPSAGGSASSVLNS